MAEHPINGLMETAMQSIKDMVDVNTIIGEPVESKDGTVIIPISKVSFGFAAGGSEFNSKAVSKENPNPKLPFGGGSGAGVNISPVSFLVVNNGNIKLIPVEYCSTVDKIVDYIPEIINKASGFVNSNKKEKKEDKENVKQTICYTYENEEDD